MARYGVGEAVRLKAGDSPVMTVLGRRKKKITVTYFDNSDQRFIREDFPPGALKPDSPKPAQKSDGAPSRA